MAESPVYLRGAEGLRGLDGFFARAFADFAFGSGFGSVFGFWAALRAV
ncbi:MAG: hypothetical protein ABL308_13490 [Oceanicaulis sp.]